MDLKEKAPARGVILPILRETDQVVLEAVQSIKRRTSSMTELPSVSATRAEIIRLGYEPPTLPTVRASLGRLIDNKYIVVPVRPAMPEIEVRSYRQEVSA